VIAIDRSAKMLAEARKKSAPRVEYARALGESLPLRDSSVEPFRVAPPGSWRSVSIKFELIVPLDSAPPRLSDSQLPRGAHLSNARQK
jgi:hypothetical protein